MSVCYLPFSQVSLSTLGLLVFNTHYRSMASPSNVGLSETVVTGLADRWRVGGEPLCPPPTVRARAQVGSLAFGYSLYNWLCTVVSADAHRDACGVPLRTIVLLVFNTHYRSMASPSNVGLSETKIITKVFRSIFR